MSLQYMLDTNIFSSLLKNPDGAVSKKIEKAGERSICCSIIVACELRYGAEKKQSDALTRRVDTILAAMPVIPLTQPVDRAYGLLRATLNSAGQPIGPNDMLIAAHALTENLTLVTANLKEFQRVRALSVENWT